MKLKELLEKRAAIAAEIKKLAEASNDKDHRWTGEDQESWVRVNEEYDQMTRQVEVAQRAEQVQADQEQVVQSASAGQEDYDGNPAQRAESVIITEEDWANTLQAWCCRQANIELNEDQIRAVKKTGINLDTKDFNVLLARDYQAVLREFRAQSTSATAGGETIPEGFVNNFEQALLAFGGVRQVATIQRTATGNDLPWPYSDDTSNTGVLLSENTQDTEQDMVTGALTLNAYKYTSKIIRVSKELLQDSAFNLANIIGRALGERIGRATNAHFTTGDGAAKPNGIVTAATVGKTAASGTAIAADELIDLLHSVDPAYRVGAGFMMHDNILLVVRKLKDSNNQYLWQDSLRAGIPQTLLGFPITVNQDMASSVAVNALTVLFGQLSKYIIRDVMDVSLVRMVERYADYHQEAFVAISRHDGDLLDAGTNPVKTLKQAAV